MKQVRIPALLADLWPQFLLKPFKKQRVTHMSRISRRSAIGIKVTKTPSVKRVSGKGTKVVAKTVNEQGTEPHVIDRASHKKFVRNVFSIREKSAAVL